MSYLNFAILFGDRTRDIAHRLREVGDDFEAERLATHSRWSWRDVSIHLSGITVCLGLFLLGKSIARLKR
jgi:hypothetical protein